MDDDDLDRFLRDRIGCLIDRAPEAGDWPVDRLTSLEPGEPSKPIGWRPVRGPSRSLLVGVLLIVVGVGVFLATNGNRPRDGRTTEAAETPVDVVSADGRLYYLPGSDIDLSLGVDASTEPTVDEGSAIVVGRPTAAGFDRLAVVSRLTTGPTFGEGDPVTIAGRQLIQARYEGGGFAERLPDGSWLEYASLSDAPMLKEIVDATTFEDGQIEFEHTPSGLRRLATISDVSGQRMTRLTYPAPDAADGTETEPVVWFWILTTNAQHPDEVLAYGAFAGLPMERTTVRGNAGFISRNSHSDPDPTAVLWYSPTGHAAALFTNLPPDEALAFANNLRSVEEDTWRAQTGR